MTGRGILYVDKIVLEVDYKKSRPIYLKEADYKKSISKRGDYK